MNSITIVFDCTRLNEKCRFVNPTANFEFSPTTTYPYKEISVTYPATKTKNGFSAKIDLEEYRRRCITQALNMIVNGEI